MAKILVVDDDIELIVKVQEWLIFHHHVVDLTHDGDEALHQLKYYQYDLAILDLDLPKKNGLTVCQEYRQSGGTIPIIMLTGLATIDDKLKGFEKGADDYLTKPFHLKELLARLQALLRRPQNYTGAILQIGHLSLDPNLGIVCLMGENLPLLPKELSLLEFFMRHPDTVFSPETLLEKIWSSDCDSTIATVYTYIKTLRKKICSVEGKSPIVTVHGRGYRFESEPKLIS
jgi:DNA-binding response OmpR family regulator